jgi:hypothetical protein
MECAQWISIYLLGEGSRQVIGKEALGKRGGREKKKEANKILYHS